MMNAIKLRNLMRQSGKTNEYYIKELKISKAKFYKRLKGANFEAMHIVKIADLLGVSVAYLFDEENSYKLPGDNVLHVNDGMINYKVKSENLKIEIENLQKEIEYLKKINLMQEKEISELNKKIKANN